MLMFLFLAGTALCCFMTALIYRKTELGKVLIQGISSYLAFYVLVSGLLFWLGAFRVERAAGLTLILPAALSAGLFWQQKGKLPKLSLRAGTYLPLAIILVAAALICGNQRADFFGTGQDEGLYQIRAMYFMNDRYEDEITFPEYQNLYIRWEKGEYVREVRDMEGLYLNVDKEEAKPEELSGVLHGLGTFPALLALWGRLFGMKKMSGILTLCYLLSIGNVWQLCRNLRFKRHFVMLSAVLYTVSPVFLWSAQNTLTEIVLAAFITHWFVLLTEEDKETRPLYTALPVLGICMLHILITVMMPLIVILYLLNYLYSRRRGFLRALLMILPGYGCGFSMMLHTAEVYTIKNFDQLFGKTGGLLNENNIEAVVWGAALVCMVLTAVFLVTGRKNPLPGLFRKLARSRKAAGIAKKVLTGLGFVTLAYFIFKYWQRRDATHYYPFFFIMGYLLMTGFILLPAAVIAVAKRGAALFWDRRLMVLSFSLYYVLWMYCGFLWVIVYYYFYYARYLTPFIFLPIVLSGYLLHRRRRAVLVPLYVVLIGLTIWQSRILYTAKDMTYAEYEVIESVTSCIGEQDAVLINEQGYRCQRVFALPIKGISGADVYFLNEVQIKRQMMDYGGRYQKVFLLSYDIGDTVKNAEDNGWKVIYRGTIHGSVYDWVEKRMWTLPYPVEATSLETPVVLLMMEEEDK
ncbi:MAG: hypothetical protein IJ600_01475 [Lachnospiraceae bacterium]|nr:hypothetical protein [Lachnospiraceae bacterium]